MGLHMMPLHVHTALTRGEHNAGEAAEISNPPLLLLLLLLLLLFLLLPPLLLLLLLLLLLVYDRDNPFARAAAQGQVEKNAPILQAVAYDLDTLQVCFATWLALNSYE
jgi:hypothetical protein